MTLFATAASTYVLKGLRESLDDVIYRISPEDTPLLSIMGREPGKAVLEEWQTDALAAAVTTNQQLEGDAVIAVSAVTATVRVGNYHEIGRKTFGISATSEAVRKAGRATEAGLQTAKKGAELKLDAESSIFANKGGDAGSTTVARQTAGLGAWIKTNVDKEAGGANPVYTSGVPAAARTDGTPRAYSETIHKSVLSKMYTSGAKQRYVFLSATNKALFSAFAGVATKTIEQTAAKAAVIVAAADIYVGEFGSITALPCRNIRPSNIDGWYIDPEFISMIQLRQMKREILPLSLDGTAYQIIHEFALKISNESAHGLAADLGG